MIHKKTGGRALYLEEKGTQTGRIMTLLFRPRYYYPPLGSLQKERELSWKRAHVFERDRTALVCNSQPGADKRTCCTIYKEIKKGANKAPGFGTSPDRKEKDRETSKLAGTVRRLKLRT